MGNDLSKQQSGRGGNALSTGDLHTTVTEFATPGTDRNTTTNTNNNFENFLLDHTKVDYVAGTTGSKKRKEEDARITGSDVSGFMRGKGRMGGGGRLLASAHNPFTEVCESVLLINDYLCEMLSSEHLRMRNVAQGI
jgi:hypothetical protein